MNKIAHSDFHDIDLHNLQNEVDDEHKDFIFEYSNLHKKNRHHSDLQNIRNSRRNSVFSVNSLQKGFFSQENLTLSL